MKPRVNNPAWVQAIQDVMDLRGRRLSAGPDQRRPERHRLPAVPRRHRLDAHLVGRRRLERPDHRHLGRRRRRRLLDQPRARTRSTTPRPARGRSSPSGPNFAPNMAYIGWGVYVMSPRRQRREEAQGGLVAPRPISAARTSRSGWRPIRRASSPTATPTSTYDEWEAAGYDRAFIEDYLGSKPTATTTRTPRSSRASPASSSTTRSPRTSWRRASPASTTAQEGADAIAAAWEKITDQIGRDNQIKLYKASLGM